MSASVRELAGDPSPESWRLLCELLAAMPEDEALRATADVAGLLAAWDDELRATMCGMSWDDRFFAGDPDPRSHIVRFLRFDRVFSGRYGGIRMRTTLFPGDLARLAASPAVQHLTRINLSNQALGAAGMENLARGTSFSSLRRLELRGCELDGAALVPLAAAPFYAGLEQLSLEYNRFEGGQIAPLVRGETLALRELAIGSNKIGRAGAVVLAAGGAPELRVLGLDDTGLGVDGAAALARRQGTLDALDVTGNRLGDAGTAALVSGALRVRELRLERNHVTAAGVRALVDSGQQFTALKLGSNALDDTAAQLLAARAPETLETLFLSDNYLTGVGLAALLASPRLQALKMLDLSTNRIGADGLAQLKPAMRRLESLTLDHNRITGEGARGLADAEAMHLTRLSLVGNRIDARALELLSGEPWFGALTALDLSRNPLGPAAGVILGARPLTALRLSGCALGDSGLAALAKADCRPTLLMLDDCAISDAGANILADSPILQQVETLYLAGNAIGDAGATALARSTAARGLKLLHIGRNAIGDDGIVALAERAGLYGLHADDNPYGERGNAALAARPARCCP